MECSDPETEKESHREQKEKGVQTKQWTEKLNYNKRTENMLKKLEQTKREQDENKEENKTPKGDKKKFDYGSNDEQVASAPLKKAIDLEKVREVNGQLLADFEKETFMVDTGTEVTVIREGVGK